ncbi:N-acyl amino acid synthase FeeM domain-containing protein [Thalassospira profundimaris]|uniref:N-acyl amino acid synthase FeeM domain-containing protein n=1 Tax=Thalassospira profundimaris TaxID=502049 RepID=UPI0015EFEE87|nr:cyclic nucleotide-binding domain-containing protein [Thalassospira profundimaris]
MSIRIKVAKTDKELSDVYHLRYQVYQDHGHFADKYDGAVVDLYDAVPSVANLIAYSNDVPVATIRVNRDSELGLPADHAFDFSGYRQKVTEERRVAGLDAPLFASAGMLAIAEEWRNRRYVFGGLLRMAADIGHMWGVTHILATVNVTTAGIYERLGWHRLADPVVVGGLGVEILPFASPMEPMYRWAFGMFKDQKGLLDQFSGCFQWYLVDGGTEIFRQEDVGDEAFLITKGSVDIMRHHDGSDRTLRLAKLGAGDMFGELSLIDSSPRSATAVASRNTELVVINRDVFWQKSNEDPQRLKDLMQILSERLRDANNLGMIYACGSDDERLAYFTNRVRRGAIPDPRDPEILKSRMSIEEFADMALVTVEQAERYLGHLQNQGILEFTARQITFFGGETK